MSGVTMRLHFVETDFLCGCISGKSALGSAVSNKCSYNLHRGCIYENLQLIM